MNFSMHLLLCAMSTSNTLSTFSIKNTDGFFYDVWEMQGVVFCPDLKSIIARFCYQSPTTFYCSSEPQGIKICAATRTTHSFKPLSWCQN